MRTAINEILAFIGQASLTNEEFESLTLPVSYTQPQLYYAIYAILIARDGVSEATDRLRDYFLAIGYDIAETKTPKSNIFLGAKLQTDIDPDAETEGTLTEEVDPVFTAWLNSNPLANFLTEETDPIFTAWLATDPLDGFLTAETDPLSLHLNQTTPQTITGGAPIFQGGLATQAESYFHADISAYFGVNFVEDELGPEIITIQNLGASQSYRMGLPGAKGTAGQVLGIDSIEGNDVYLAWVSWAAIEETDPIFAAWLLTDPLAGFLTEETDPEFSAWIETSPLSGFILLDQTSPQEVTNGKLSFIEGIDAIKGNYTCDLINDNYAAFFKYFVLNDTTTQATIATASGAASFNGIFPVGGNVGLGIATQMIITASPFLKSFAMVAVGPSFFSNELHLLEITTPSSPEAGSMSIYPKSDGKLYKLDSDGNETEIGSGAGGGYTDLTEFIDQTAWRLFYSDGNGDVKELALGADGTFLKSNGASAAPTFDTPAASADNKVKYDTDDTSNGFLSEKTVAGTGITLAEGTAGDADKLKITNSDTGSAAVGTHENSYDHTKLHDAATISDTDTIDMSITGQEISGAVKKQMSITSDTSGLKLEGDASSPGNSKLYGTNASGTKGWYDQPTGTEALKHFTATIYSDASWDNEEVPIFQAPDGQAITITKVQATVMGTDTPRLDYNIEERGFASLASAGTDIFSSDVRADSDGTTSTSFSNSGIAANAHLVFTTGSSAQLGTVNLITITVFYELA